jgi:hypothetical protein
MGVLAVLAEVAEVTSAVAAAGEKVAEVANQLVTQRSIVVEVDNHLNDIVLRRVREKDNFSSGEFGVLPDDEIPPHIAEIFGVQSKGGGIGTGVVGSVTYSGPGFTMLVGFNNPAAGNNTANISLQGSADTITRFRVSCLIGAGNTAAHARYQLNRHAPYSILKFVADNHIILRDPNQQPPSLVNDGLTIALPRSGFDLPPKGVPLRFRALLVTGGDQAATSSS